MSVEGNRTVARKLEELRERGCVCGGEAYSPCPLHEPGDNRGLRAWLQAGMPLGFPMVNCTCGVCGADGCVMYPDPRLDDPAQPFEHRPTLVCPRCSAPASERRLRQEAIDAGYELNEATVFGEAVLA